MKFGLMYANAGPFAFPALATHRAQIAGRVRIEALRAVAHVVVPFCYASPYPCDPSGKMPAPAQMRIPDPLVWLGYVAAVTRKICLATGIVILLQRNPLYV